HILHPDAAGRFAAPSLQHGCVAVAAGAPGFVPMLIHPVPVPRSPLAITLQSEGRVLLTTIDASTGHPLAPTLMEAIVDESREHRMLLRDESDAAAVRFIYGGDLSARILVRCGDLPPQAFALKTGAEPGAMRTEVLQLTRGVMLHG